jgi:hypothetical protein
MTYEELKKETNNFEPIDFWYWFLSPNHIDMDTKVHMLIWLSPEPSDKNPKAIVDYMKETGQITGVRR